jgi:hypothetical protein
MNVFLIMKYKIFYLKLSKIIVIIRVIKINLKIYKISLKKLKMISISYKFKRNTNNN